MVKKNCRIVNLGSIGVKFGEMNITFRIFQKLEFFPKITATCKKKCFNKHCRVGVTKTKIHKKLPKKNLKKSKSIPEKEWLRPTS